MARPRKPSNVMEFTGAFKHDPARERVDIQGTGEFSLTPPEKLHKNYHGAWKYLVERLPAFSFTASDEPIVAHAARLLATSWEYERNSEMLLKVHAPLMACFQALGLSPSARTKLGSNGNGNQKKNKFAALNDE
jgi:hypothetical protein